MKLLADMIHYANKILYCSFEFWPIIQYNLDKLIILIK